MTQNSEQTAISATVLHSPTSIPYFGFVKTPECGQQSCYQPLASNFTLHMRKIKGSSIPQTIQV